MEWNREIMQKPMWKEEISNREEKEKIARRMAEKVQDGEVVGFGSGSTSYLTAKEIANKIQKENITITAIPTTAPITAAMAITVIRGISSTTTSAIRADQLTV